MLDVMSRGRLVAGMVIGGGPGILLLSGQPDPCARTLPRGPRPHRQGVDDAGAVSVELEALLLPLRQSLAAAAPAAAPADLDSRRRQPGNHRVRRPAPLRLHGHSVFSYRHVSSASSACSATPAARPVTRRRRGRWAGACRSTWPRPTRQAREEFEPHFWYFVKKLMKNISLAPPGYTSPRSALAILKNRGSFLAEQKRLGRHRRRRLRHRRQPRDGAAEARPLSQGARRRRRADRLPDRHAGA